MEIAYKIKKATQKDLLLHLQKCDDLFVPKLSSKVDLETYVQKITTYAQTFEAWNETELIGLIAAYFNDLKQEIGFITNVSVFKDFSNQGIGMDLLKMTKEYALQHSFHKINLEVHPENKKALQFYLKNDFKITMQDADSVIMEFDIK